MPSRRQLVESQAMQLSPQERSDLADKLWLSVHSSDDVDAAWAAEVSRRAVQVDNGEVDTVPWDAVMDGLRAKLR